MRSHPVRLDVWFLVWPSVHCRLAFIRENFIFANIHEFDVSRIQHSREIFEYMVFTKESIKHREFKFPRISFTSQNREKKNMQKIKCFTVLPYFMCANSEGSGETARMRRLAWAFTDHL